MALFRHFPTVRPRLNGDEHIIPLAERSTYPMFDADFKTLDKELMPFFRQFDEEAIISQYRYRRIYVFIIFGSALTAMLAIVQIAFINTSGLDVTEGILAAVLTVASVFLSKFSPHNRYMNTRLAAERLRSEYFLFLGHLDHYANDHDRVRNLIMRVAEIKMGGEQE
jgi:ABC-type Fe3+-siderophore transport system permease subunit